jgi:hypothetical protein
MVSISVVTVHALVRPTVNDMTLVKMSSEHTNAVINTFSDIIVGRYFSRNAISGYHGQTDVILKRTAMRY